MRGYNAPALRRLPGNRQKLYPRKTRFLGEIILKEISMRPIIAVFLTCLALAACGSTEHKTVVVNPAPDSTTVVDADGHTRVIEH